MKDMQTHWDPSGTPMRDRLAQKRTRKLERLYRGYQKHPAKLTQGLVLCICFAVLVWLVEWQIGAFSGSLFLTLALPLLPLLIYTQRISSLQVDLTKLAVAHSQGWLYSPESDHGHWSRLAKALPEIFKKGNRSQTVEDEFWGTLVQERHLRPFWLGDFSYSIKYGEESANVLETVYAFRLDKPAPADFVAQPETGATRFANLFSKKDIDLEAIEFNRLFNISYKGRRSDIDKDVFRTLNPAVLAALIDFYAACGSFTLVFRGTTMAVSFEGKYAAAKHTDFFKRVAVDERDIAAFREKIEQVLRLACEVVTRLD